MCPNKLADKLSGAYAKHQTIKETCSCCKKYNYKSSYNVKNDNQIFITITVIPLKHLQLTIQYKKYTDMPRIKQIMWEYNELNQDI